MIDRLGNLNYGVTELMYYYSPLNFDMFFSPLLLIKFLLPVGGEESTIEFMESHSLMDSGTPLLKEAHSNGVVEHPFPLNCVLKEWYLGPEFYHAVKVGIVQYVCEFFFSLKITVLFSFCISLPLFNTYWSIISR